MAQRRWDTGSGFHPASLARHEAAKLQVQLLAGSFGMLDALQLSQTHLLIYSACVVTSLCASLVCVHAWSLEALLAFVPGLHARRGLCSIEWTD